MTTTIVSVNSLQLAYHARRAPRVPTARAGMNGANAARGMAVESCHVLDTCRKDGYARQTISTRDPPRPLAQNQRDPSHSASTFRRATLQRAAVDREPHDAMAEQPVPAAPVAVPAAAVVPAAAPAAAAAPPARPRNRIQVSREKRPLYFFIGLAKKFLVSEDEVELSGLGLAVTTVVTVAEILKNSGHVTISSTSRARAHANHRAVADRAQKSQRRSSTCRRRGAPRCPRRRSRYGSVNRPTSTSSFTLWIIRASTSRDPVLRVRLLACRLLTRTTGTPRAPFVHPRPLPPQPLRPS